MFKLTFFPPGILHRESHFDWPLYCFSLFYERLSEIHCIDFSFCNRHINYQKWPFFYRLWHFDPRLLEPEDRGAGEGRADLKDAVVVVEASEDKR